MTVDEVVDAAREVLPDLRWHGVRPAQVWALVPGAVLSVTWMQGLWLCSLRGRGAPAAQASDSVRDGLARAARMAATSPFPHWCETGRAVLAMLGEP